MRIVFIGSVKFSLDMLEVLAEMNVSIVGVCTKKSSKFNSDFVDLSSYCKEKSLPWIFCEDINSAESISWISSLRPDVIFCFGWSQIIKREILEIPPLGVFGFHPSALPKNRGRHPIVWALVLGLTETASTFFRMDDGADSGDIVSQVKVDIKPDYDASSLYEEITRIAKLQLAAFVPKLALETLVMLKQDNSLSNVWRKRKHIDGEIDWRMSAESIHNLVRGLSKPYIGAHFMHEGKEIKVWKTAITEVNDNNIEPGKILAITQTGTLVKCGIGAIRIVETDPPLELVEGDYL
jgi:methionyl-tRNA formyltransferase